MTVVREAHAKVNAFLRVKGVREDGYHEIESLVLPLDLRDTVSVSPAEGLRVDVHGAASVVSAVEEAGMNLALVAALALAETCGATSSGALIEIEKRIPVAAGLGGGSADAAAALHALNELWGCGLAIEDLITLGERVGSDVPALLVGAPVVVGGRGDEVERIQVEPTAWAVHPFDFPTRSPDAYRWWDEDGAETGPDPGVLYAAAETGQAETMGAGLFNDLEGPVARRHPEIAAVKAAFLDAGALGAVMSGSGPTVVALAKTPMHVDRLCEAVPGSFPAMGLAE